MGKIAGVLTGPVGVAMVVACPILYLLFRNELVYLLALPLVLWAWRCEEPFPFRGSDPGHTPAPTHHAGDL